MAWERKPNNAATAARIKEYNSAEYKQAKAAARVLVNAGRAYCWRPTCRRWINPAKPWHLGHDDHDRSIIRGPEHPACNLQAAARKGRAMQGTKQPRWRSRHW